MKSKKVESKDTSKSRRGVEGKKKPAVKAVKAPRPAMTVDVEAFIQLLSVQSESYDQERMEAYIMSVCEGMDVSVKQDNGNLYITKGSVGAQEFYPCMVAHMDTVHRIVPDNEYRVLEMDGELFAFNPKRKKMTGVGGDDKVGIFIALEMLKKHDVFKCAFFRDEEVGCEGSEVADMSFFQDTAYVLQCDRRGNNEWITNASGVALSDKGFIAAIQPELTKHGYKTAFGAMTDVMALKQNGLAVAAANMGCGYYNPHCDNEYIVIHDVGVCMSLVNGVITSLGCNKYEHTYTRPSYDNYSYKGTRSQSGNSFYNYDQETYMTTKSILAVEGFKPDQLHDLVKYGISNSDVKIGASQPAWVRDYQGQTKDRSGYWNSQDFVHNRTVKWLELLEQCCEVLPVDQRLDYVKHSLKAFIRSGFCHSTYVKPEDFLTFGTTAFATSIEEGEEDSYDGFGKYGLCLYCSHAKAISDSGLCKYCADVEYKKKQRSIHLDDTW